MKKRLTEALWAFLAWAFFGILFYVFVLNQFIRSMP